MADEETKEWAEKSRRIEAERQKAAQAVEREGQSKADLAYLDPNETKVKGFSRDPNVELASMERLANRSFVLVIGGVALGVIASAAEIVVQVGNLGLAGVVIAGIPQAVSAVCIGVGVLVALVVVGFEIKYKVKNGKRIGTAFWTALGTIAVIGVYVLLRMIITFS